LNEKARRTVDCPVCVGKLKLSTIKHHRLDSLRYIPGEATREWNRKSDSQFVKNESPPREW